MHASTPPSPRRKPSRGSVRLLVLTVLWLAGCQSVTRPPSQVDRLIAHPEFRHAAAAAPHFTTDVLSTIADLEARAK